MKMLSLPEHHSDQVRWLESAVMGPDFDRVIAELSAVFGGESFDLTDSEKEAINESGFSKISPDRFKQLLKSPTALVQLQREVIEFGGDHWNTVMPSDSQSAVIERARPVSLSRAKGNGRRSQSWANNAAWAAIGALAAAAAVMIILSGKNDLVDQPVTVAVNPAPEESITNSPSNKQITDSQTWGFEKFANSDLVTASEVDRKEYLDKIASAAQAWSKKRPATPAALAKRLGEFRMGCSAIMLADHPLPAADQRWLKDRCKQWAAAIENHLQELEGGMSVEEVTTRVDATVTKIAAAIKGRSATS